MPTARPLPETGSIFLDARGGDRALRVSWHHESGLVVLSLWRDNVCAGSFRLAVDEVPDLIDTAARRPRPGYDVAPTPSAAGPDAADPAGQRRRTRRPCDRDRATRGVRRPSLSTRR